VLCEVNFVHKCFREYHSKHRPGFIRSLPDIKVLSSSSVGDVERLTGDALLNFLLRLDSAIRKRAERVFNSNWFEVADRVPSALEGESLDAVNCKDFTDVLDIAGIPSIASSLIWNLKSGCAGSRSNVSAVSLMEPSLMSYLKTRYSGTNTSGEYVDKSTTSGDGSSLGYIVEGGHAGSSSVSIPVYTHAETGIVCATVGVPPIQYADLLGVKLHLGSAELICRLFRDLRESARLSYSRSMYNYLSTAMNSELSTIGRAIWCKIYRELHLSSFMSRCLCIYHYKYRPDFIRTLPSIRVLSSTSDCELVPLNGGVLLDFLSKLDCAAFNVVQSVFESQWDVVAGKVFARLEDGSLSDVSCEDVISVLDTADIPASAFSALQRKIRTGKEKVSGNSSGKVASGGATSVSATTGLVSPSSSLQLQSELLSQPETKLLSEGTGSSSSIVIEPVPQRRHTISKKSKRSGSGSKIISDGTASVSATTGLVSPSPSSQFQSELLSQSEPELLSEGTGPYLPVVTETITQRSVISKGKTSEGSSKCADACSTATLTHSSVISSARLRSELSHQSETQLRSLLLFDEGKRNQPSRRFVKLLSYRDQPANLSDIVAVSTSDDPTSNCSDFGPLVGEVSPAPSFQPSISFAPLPLSSSLSTSESGPQFQHEMQLGSLSGECFSRISADVSVSTLEGDASDLRALEDGASSSASDSVVAVSSSSVSAFAPLSAPASELLVASDISSPLLPLAEVLSMPTVSDQSGVISTSVALPGVESSSPVDGYIAVPTPSVGSF
uniref:hypothetical protein n=1 Tax=Candidatus Ichthyocystis sparus TaxID=1561004 RepID=UPI00159EBF57